MSHTVHCPGADDSYSLSKELYTKPAHFVLEMIQNVDDNEYTVKAPILEIELFPSHMQLWNNEVGFEEKHVKAFCSIGNSTKKKQKGYTGEFFCCGEVYKC